MNLFACICLFAVLLLARSQTYDDEEDYDEAWQSVYFSDSDEEQEAIIRAMERAFSSRTMSTAASSSEDFSDYSSADDEESVQSRISFAPKPRHKFTRRSSGEERLEQDDSVLARDEDPSNPICDCRSQSIAAGEDLTRGSNSTGVDPNPNGHFEYFPIPKSYFHVGPDESSRDLKPSHPLVLVGTKVPKLSVGANDKPQPTESATSQPALTISPWVRRFLSKCHKDALLPVPRDFLVDNFNLVLLPEILSLESTLFRKAWKLLVSVKEKDDKNHQDVEIESAATSLYLRLHQRFLLSHRGMDMVRRRLKVSPVFGRCPLPSCQGTPLLPIGFDGNEQVAQRYCVRCRNLWMHWDSIVPGWAWGDSFCHLFVLEHGEEVFGRTTFKTETGEKCLHRVVPQIFGFQLHPSAKYG